MIYTSITDNDSFYLLEAEDGANKLFLPKATTIVINDESGLLSIKMVGSRKTIALVQEDEHPY